MSNRPTERFLINFHELSIMGNCLPGDTVDFLSLSAFKRLIKRVDLSDFLKFT